MRSSNQFSTIPRSLAWLVGGLVFSLSACHTSSSNEPVVEPVPACKPPDIREVTLNEIQEKYTKLSDWCVLQNEGQTLKTLGDVVPYDVNTPLFSDYTLKFRTVWVPPGEQVAYSDTERFSFPAGTILTKTFAYAEDLQHPEGNRVLIETRVLLRTTNEWLAIPYIWNASQQEATLKLGGDFIEVKQKDKQGAPSTFSYLVPNKNQCIKCHSHNEVIDVIGPTARTLNRDYAYPSGNKNQLSYWNERGILRNAPDPSQAPRMVHWDDQSASTNDRARAWLEMNCGHCHNETGAARTSGLYLTVSEMDPARYGVCKAPVAAGAGSGGLKYGIVPGKPDESILVYRIESTNPEIMMPELGRALVHQEGVDLIRAWVAQLPGNCQ
jgi:uncharacterized repeat protein (TIGR03806 family)